jgi:hypothetical protein
MRVTITALPRQGYRGFGAVERYFLSGVPETIEVTDAQFAELTSDPASYFLKVEKTPSAKLTDKPPEAPPKPAPDLK